MCTVLIHPDNMMLFTYVRDLFENKYVRNCNIVEDDSISKKDELGKYHICYIVTGNGFDKKIKEVKLS